MNKTTRILASMLAAALLSLPFAVYADLEIQNAQYSADKGLLHVKGRLSGDGVAKVYVLNAKNNRQIGSIDTYSKGLQFNGDLPIADASQAPCTIKVQTKAPTAFGRMFGSGGSAGDFSIAIVSQAPESCNP